MSLTQVSAHSPSVRQTCEYVSTDPIPPFRIRLARGFLGLCLAVAGGLLGTSAQAQANLQISSFTYNTPVLNGSTNAFTVVAKNGGDASASDARLRVFLPANFTFSAAPAGCAIE